jgi:hypothetical protein
MPYGVGSGNGGIDHFELGLTIIEREPRLFIVNMAEKRALLTAEELLNQNKFTVKCAEYGVTIPLPKSRVEWNNYLNKNIETATKVPPTLALRTNAAEIEILTLFFGNRISNFMRIGEKEDDGVRVRIEERKIYFKWAKLARFLANSYNSKDEMSMRRFVDKNCDYHVQGPGYRDWWRCTYSIKFDQFSEEDLEKWFAEGPRLVHSRD